MLAPILFGLIITSDEIDCKVIAKKLGIFFVCLLAFCSVYFICSPYNFIDPLGRKSSLAQVKLLHAKTNSMLNLSNISIDKKKDGPRQKQQVSVQTQVKGVINYLDRLYRGMGFIILVASIFGFMLIALDTKQRFDLIV